MWTIYTFGIEEVWQEEVVNIQNKNLVTLSNFQNHNYF